MKEKKRVLIADDSRANQELITEILGEDRYHYAYADNGSHLIELLEQDQDADIILLDINMPIMDGFEVLRIMRERNWLSSIPVVVISAENDSEFLQKAYSLGATDFISRPICATAVRYRVENTLMLYSKQRQLVQLVEEQVLEREEINSAMIHIFSRTIEQRNNESGRHTLNIRMICDILLHRLVQITDRYPLNERIISTISTLSALHDIGKIAVPESILNKPGRLTPEEWHIMKTHAAKGDEIVASLSDLQSPVPLTIAREICRWHHERWDGRGYPDGLAGDAIPISAQVVALADAYDALTGDRCYKSAISHEEAVYMILNDECGAFNPLLLQCLKDVAPKLAEVTGSEKCDLSGEAEVLADEMLRDRDLPSDDRSKRLLAYEKEKKEFFEEQAGGIQFEYDCPSQKITLIQYLDGKKKKTMVSYGQRSRIRLISAADCDILQARVKKMSRRRPEAVMETDVLVNGKFRRHRLTVRTVWPAFGNRPVGILGQFTDIHDETLREGLGGLFSDTAGVAAALDLLKDAFELVRLVDPDDRCVLSVTREGTVQNTPFRCYDYWNTGRCCGYCSAVAAQNCRGLKTSLETKDGKLYSLVSKYVKIGERECVLELGFPMTFDGEKGKKPTLPERARVLLLHFYRDSVTNVYSRAYLEDFKMALEHADGVAVADIDGLRAVNDAYGRSVGDALLRHIAEQIRLCVGTFGEIVRYGGDSFVIVFNSIRENDFTRLLSEISEKVQTSRMERYPDLVPQISIGGAFRAGSLSDAVTEADRDMYRRRTETRTEE